MKAFRTAIALAWLMACGDADATRSPELVPEVARPVGQSQDDPIKRRVVSSKPHKFAAKSKQAPPGKTLHFDWSEPEQEEKKNQGSEPEPKRDYARELLALIGDPTGCITAADAEAAPAQVIIEFATTVSAQGVITRVEATSGGLPDRALTCLKKRLDAARFKPLVEDAPRRVEATITLSRQPKPAPAAAQ